MFDFTEITHNDQVDIVLKAIRSGEAMLEQYLRGLHEQTQGKVKKLDMATGKIYLKKSTDKLTPVASFAPKENLDSPFVYNRQQVGLDRTAINNYVKEHGCPPDCVVITPGELTFKYDIFKEASTEPERIL